MDAKETEEYTGALQIMVREWQKVMRERNAAVAELKELRAYLDEAVDQRNIMQYIHSLRAEIERLRAERDAAVAGTDNATAECDAVLAENVSLRADIERLRGEVQRHLEETDEDEGYNWAWISGIR